MNFSEFTGGDKVERVMVVVSFLAMLELIKQGSIIVHQETVFSDISMETNMVKTPKY